MVGKCSPGVARRAASASALDASITNRKLKLTFEPSKRLHQAAEFRAVRQRGRRFSDSYFVVSVIANRETHPRLGLAIATRSCGNSVGRNLVKRLARESFRLQQHELPPVDVTVTARDAARHATASTLRASLAKHWHSIARQT